MLFSSFSSKSIAAACALAHVASAGMYIPTTSIENTSEYFDGVSRNWENIESLLKSQMSQYKEDGNYGAYAIMTSIYNSEIPDKFDSKYLSSLLSKLEQVGTETWDDSELSSLGSEYLVEESSKSSGSLSRAVGAGSLAIAAIAGLALGAF
ncbi:hypothetical protein LPJ64_006026 [Coemansia asiatica]|uniref:Uncharacterized protein n=1 Tax=Coemansia asiatica TaxID=1052880 RepID=A0A9W7XG38_9FUNG|nr:hypothetical protein LPJ64_006026 [Coemansia asiatica]